jgi:Co/Zn/Cd efflux system component
MKKSLFKISHMDCPSEEKLIRMKLDGMEGINGLDFNLSDRQLTVYHTSDPIILEQAIQELNLGGKRIATEETETAPQKQNTEQKKLLWTVLLINFAFFLIEIVYGWISGSMGLVADSLDMLADAFVYGISLLAVGAAISRKKNVARIAGYFQLLLALAGFAEIIRRFLGNGMLPDPQTMITISIFALAANAICLYLLQKSESKEEAHMKASLIFTSNDVIINLGVVIAGLLVTWTSSPLPDLIIGAIIFIVVVRGALLILKVSK